MSFLIGKPVTGSVVFLTDSYGAQTLCKQNESKGGGHTGPTEDDLDIIRKVPWHLDYTLS